MVAGPGQDVSRGRIRVGIVGAGSWGTTASMVCAASPNVASVVIWARSQDTVFEINSSHTNARYLPGVTIPVGVHATADIAGLVATSDIVVMAVPSHGFREILSGVAAAGLDPTTPIVSLAKGLEAGTQMRMSEIAAEVCPGNPFAVLTGPNLAGEIAAGQPTASVVAARDADVAAKVRDAFSAPMFRVYVNDDVIGCELAGVVKNVIAVAVGMAEGFGLGHNSRAALITRGLAEMTRLGTSIGGHSETFAGLAGMGDLIATCYSSQSRNNSVGRRLGRGEKIADITSSMSMVAEGVKSAVSVLGLALANGVEMPVVQQVVNVCEHGETFSVPDALTALLKRSVGSE